MFHYSTDGRFTNPPRCETVVDRVRKSQLFPRIRDAEVEMKRNEKEFQDHVHLRNFKKKQRKEYKERIKKGLESPPLKQPKIIKKVEPKQYFTNFVLDKDPNASKYMPFDRVYFPKLFDEDTKNVPPESKFPFLFISLCLLFLVNFVPNIIAIIIAGLDSLWLLGFQDMAIQKL